MDKEKDTQTTPVPQTQEPSQSESVSKPEPKEVSVYSETLNYLPRLVMMLSMWLFGFRLVFTCLTGYTAYSEGKKPYWFAFFTTLLWYFFGLWYTLFTLLVVGVYQLILHKETVLNGAKMVKTNYQLTKKSLQLQKEMEELVEDDAKGDDKFDLARGQEKVEWAIDKCDKVIEQYNKVKTMAVENKGTQYAVKYYKLANEFLHKDNVYRVLKQVDGVLEAIVNFVKESLKKLPYMDKLQKLSEDVNKSNSMLHYPYEEPETESNVALPGDETSNFSAEVDEQDSGTKGEDQPEMNMMNLGEFMKNNGNMAMPPPPKNPEEMMKNLNQLGDMLGQLANMQSSLEKNMGGQLPPPPADFEQSMKQLNDLREMQNNLRKRK